MTKQKTTKKTLLTSVLSLILCMAMLIGTTFAWFTDSVTSGKNRIQAGNLDVAMSYKNTSMADWEDVETPTSPDFFRDINGEQILWEPGAVAYANFKVENKGSLALKYSLETIVAACNYTPAGKSLADVLTVKVINDEITYATREDAVVTAKGSTDTLESFAHVNENMEKDTIDYFTVVLYWEPSSNDNDFNVNTALYIDIELSLVATQAVNEADSFNNQYDANAEYPKLAIKASSAKELATAFASGGEKPIALACDIEDFSGAITTAAIVDLGGYTLNSKAIAVKEDLNISNGNVSMRTTSGYLDIRPTEDGVYTFKNVDFVNEHKSKANNNTGSDRIDYMVKLYPMAKDIKSTFVFENCTFENACVYFGSSSDKPADIDVTFKNCTFNAMMGSDAVIEISSTTTGTLNIEDCTFNITATYANQAVIDIRDWSSVTVDVTATNNILNANKAIPYTYDPAKGETEVDSVKIGNVTSVRNYYLFDALSGGYSTINETGTVLNGNVAIESKYVGKAN